MNFQTPDSCWSALENLETITKKFQRCNLEKMTMEQLYWDCESNMITSIKSFVRTFEENQKKYSRIGLKKILNLWQPKNTDSAHNNNFRMSKITMTSQIPVLLIKSWMMLFLRKKSILEIMIVCFLLKLRITLVKWKVLLHWQKIWEIMIRNLLPLTFEFSKWLMKLPLLKVDFKISIMKS